jgi:hypothetical protein
MHDMNEEGLRKHPKQVIILAIRKKLNCNSTDLSAASVETNLTACGSRKEFVAVTDPEKRYTSFQQRRYPFFQLDTSWEVVRHHRL